MAGTITQTAYTTGHIRRIRFTCTADATAATFPDTVVTEPIDGRLLRIVTNPGATAPQDDYDVTLVDQNGVDQLQGVGADRDKTNTEEARIVYSGTTDHPYISPSDTLTLKIGGNNVNSALTVIDLYYALGG